ncbi:MAG: precorrin-2 dehydrogenase/sirohydrochlorin ferrochelatase family protein [Granulosicoccaceae bacterium]
MKQLPIYCNLEQRECLVIGGDHAALCKVEMLLKAGALVHVNATELHPKLKQLLSQRAISFSESSITDLYGHSYALVFIADCEEKRAGVLYQQCLEIGVPVNVVDQPALCSFTVPSIIDRNPITIAIGSAGSSPVLARRLRAMIEALVPKATGTLANLLGQHRPLVAKMVPQKQRRHFWDSVLDGPVAHQVILGNMDAACKHLQQAIEDYDKAPAIKLNPVTLIDARHNDSELMTLQAVQAMHRAEHIMHAPSIKAELLELSRRDAHFHQNPRLDQEFTVALHRLTEKLQALVLEGQPVVLLINNSGWPKTLIYALENRLQSKGIPCRLLASAEQETKGVFAPS